MSTGAGGQQTQTSQGVSQHTIIKSEIDFQRLVRIKESFIQVFMHWAKQPFIMKSVKILDTSIEFKFFYKLIIHEIFLKYI